MSLEEFVFSVEKRYSFPVLVLLYRKKELTFDQIYDLSVGYKWESVKTRGNVLGEKKGKYGAISRESISRAVSELLKAKYVKKEARLSRKGRACAVYVLTEKTRRMMDSFIKA
jgi:DNA-binding MarR family transcriptional regulator